MVPNNKTLDRPDYLENAWLEHLRQNVQIIIIWIVSFHCIIILASVRGHVCQW